MYDIIALVDDSFYVKTGSSEKYLFEFLFFYYFATSAIFEFRKLNFHS